MSYKEELNYEYQVVIKFSNNNYVNYERSQNYSYVLKAYEETIEDLKDLPCEILLTKVKGNIKECDEIIKSIKLNATHNIFEYMNKLNKEHKRYIEEFEIASQKIYHYDILLNKFYHSVERDSNMNKLTTDYDKIMKMDDFLRLLKARRKNKSKLYLYKNLCIKIASVKNILLKENTTCYVGSHLDNELASLNK